MCSLMMNHSSVTTPTLTSQGRHRRRFLRAVVLLSTPLFALVTGCDNAKSGTNVQMSEEAKALIQARREGYKARAAQSKGKSRGASARRGSGSRRKG